MVLPIVSAALLRAIQRRIRPGDRGQRILIGRVHDADTEARRYVDLLAVPRNRVGLERGPKIL